MTPEIQLVKVVRDELVALMGSERMDLEVSVFGPQIVLLAGLQGVGKTTACAKLALLQRKNEKKVVVIAADVYRPAAVDQLMKLGQKVDVDVFALKGQTDPVVIVKRGVEHARQLQADVVIVDTAGRLQVGAARRTGKPGDRCHIRFLCVFAIDFGSLAFQPTFPCVFHFCQFPPFGVSVLSSCLSNLLSFTRPGWLYTRSYLGLLHDLDT